MHDRPELGPLFAEFDLAARDPAHVEQVVDKPRQLPDLTLHDFRRRAQRIAPVPGKPEGSRGVADRRERIAQLMRQHREELVLATVGIRQIRGQPAEVVFEALSFGDVLTDRRKRDRLAR